MAKHPALPHVQLIQPKKLTHLGQMPNRHLWTAEPKSDGYRGALHYDAAQEECWFMNKKGGRHEGRFAPLCQAVVGELRGTTSVILDGEIVNISQQGAWARHAMRSKGAVHGYVAFDILWLNGEDLRRLPLRERRKRLAQILPKGSSIVAQVPCFEYADLGKLLDWVESEPLEGIVLKRSDRGYSKKRVWYKFKNSKYKGKAEPSAKKKAAWRA